MIVRYIMIVMGCLFVSQSFAETNWNEHIIKFNSDIVVNSNASITVTENIKAYINQQQLKYGIVRSLPLTVSNSYGMSHNLQYKVIAVQLNKRAVPYKLENQGKDLFIRIEDAKKTLNPGYYEYTLRYQVLDAVGFISDQDELFWNITGNWPVPMLNVKAKITLPKGAAIAHYQGHTETQIARTVKFTISQPAKNTIVYSARYLAPNAGLSIGIDWAPGTVTRPPLTWHEEIQQTIQKIVRHRWSRTINQEDH